MPRARLPVIGPRQGASGTMGAPKGVRLHRGALRHPPMQSVVQENCENPQALVAQGFEPLFFLGLKGGFLGLQSKKSMVFWETSEGCFKRA